MANNPGTILKRIKDEEIEWVDLRFTDPKGKWQHLSMCSGVVDEDQLTDGFMFDGSSIAGWKAINESDMKPSVSMSSSITHEAMVKCCHLPFGSVKRRSTHSTSLSWMVFKMVRASSAMVLRIPVW